MRERESGETEGEISIGKNIEYKKEKSFIYGCFNTRRPRETHFVSGAPLFCYCA